jgi:hypothetical protein
MTATKKLYKNVELLLTDEQVEVLQRLLEEPANEWLKIGFQNIIETDDNGLIVIFRPMQKMSMGLVFFFQNLMIEQRLYLMDNFLRENGQIK